MSWKNIFTKVPTCVKLIMIFVFFSVNFFVKISNNSTECRVHCVYMVKKILHKWVCINISKCSTVILKKSIFDFKMLMCSVIIVLNCPICIGSYSHSW